jgi:uncharacterized glyoxalase superfamily protein PhnB
MKLNPHLNFNGNCAEAYRFYEQHLGAKPRCHRLIFGV